jgi:hypothetical protein
MFFTRDDDEIPVPVGIVEPGEHYWNDVQLRLFITYYLVTFVVDDPDEGGGMSTLLCLYFDHVLAIADAFEVKQIALITPGHENGTGGWQMESLREVWRASEPSLDKTDTAVLWVTETGERHVESHLDTPESQLVNLRNVYDVHNATQ